MPRCASRRGLAGIVDVAIIIHRTHSSAAVAGWPRPRNYSAPIEADAIGTRTRNNNPCAGGTCLAHPDQRKILKHVTRQCFDQCSRRAHITYTPLHAKRMMRQHTALAHNPKASQKYFSGPTRCTRSSSFAPLGGVPSLCMRKPRSFRSVT